MILDTSVLIAILLQEPAGEELIAKVRSAPSAGIAAPAFLEASMVLQRHLAGDPTHILRAFLDELNVGVIPFTSEHSRVAVQAFLRFGKGRHPAALNFGDCMVYAVASLAKQPLLYTGNDFAQTDLRPA